MENVAEVYSMPEWLKWLNPTEWSLKTSADECSLGGESPMHLLCVSCQKVLCLSLMHGYPKLFGFETQRGNEEYISL